MNDTLIATLVAEVLQRIHRRVLVLLTPSDEEPIEVTECLARVERVEFSILPVQGMTASPQLERWLKLGNRLHVNSQMAISDLDAFSAVLVPGLTMATVGEVAHGLFLSESASLIQYALMKDVPVLALGYQCNPLSERNQMKGLHRSTSGRKQIDNNLQAVRDCGVKIGNLDELTQWLSATVREPHSERQTETQTGGAISAAESSDRYITLQDVMQSHWQPEMGSGKLTDLAIEYLKEQKHHQSR